MPAKNDTIKKILLIHRLNQGDLILAQPGIAALKHLYPSAEVALICSDFSALVAQYIQEIDFVWAYQKFINHGNKEARLLRKAKKWKPDLTFGLSPTPDKRIYRRLLWLRNTSAFADTHKFNLLRKLSLSTPVQPPEFSHVCDRLAYLLSGTKAKTHPKLNYNNPPVAEYQYDLLIRVSARKPSNRLSLSQLEAILKHFGKTLNIAVTAAPQKAINPSHNHAESEEGKLLKLCQQYPCTLYNELEISEEYQLIANSKVILTPDGGMMHFAAALEKPVVELLGNDDIAVWGVRGENCICLQPDSKKVSDLPTDKIIAAVTKYISAN